MKRIQLIIICFVLAFTVANGQIENLRTHKQMTQDCKQCHICDTPTKANPCLILCPRNKLKVVRHLPSEGPKELQINEIETEHDLYQPVNFSHKLHSEMSLMAGGCSICHHYNPPGKIVKCSRCHEKTRTRTDLSKPDLKGAFHRQCIDCHETWEEKAECESCHLLNNQKPKIKKNAIIEKVHPDIKIPAKILYETNSEEGKYVTYFHNDHSSLFGIECSDCHDQESCANCHADIQLTTLNKDVHDNCSSCHNTDDKCNKCHKDKIDKPFDHLVKTGFDISIFHSGLICTDCHKTKNKFTGLNSDCLECHKNTDGNFNHSITGLKLDDNHFDLECENCHNPKNYSSKPTCDECHDEINFPSNIPGERVKK